MKKLFLSVLSVITLVTLSACGQPKEEFKPSLDTNKSCDIKVIGDYSNFEALENEFDRFNEIYPNVGLSYEKKDNYKETLANTNLLDGNDKPNIFFSYTSMIGDPKYDKVVEHMEDFSNSVLKSNLDCIRPELIHREKDGKVLLIPVFSRTYGMLVNNDLFNKHNISIPTNMNELVSVCNSFKEKGIKSPLMGYSKASDSSNGLMYAFAYPLVLASLSGNKEAINLANNLDSQAGEYMRNALNTVKSVIQNGCIDLTETDKIADNYNSLLLRFFEGDVPMMACGDAVAGTKKREEQSQAFTDSPFNYSFMPIPLTNEGGYFIDSPSIEFSVNKDCENLDMTNEFMRFLISNKELNEMSAIKRLVTPTKTMSFDSVYAPFAKVPTKNIMSPEVLGIKDALTKQIRIASFKVGRGEISVDDAISQYGTF